MRKLTAGLAITLDGVVEAPSAGGWFQYDDEVAAIINKGIAEADAILLGRRTYLEFAEIWPPMAESNPMAAFMNNTPKYIASSVLTTLDWANSTLIGMSLNDAVAALKKQTGGNILIPGSPRLVRSMLRDGLLDELSVMIHPIVLGTGMRLFEEMPAQVGLRLVDSRALRSGVLSVTYQPIRS